MKKNAIHKLHKILTTIGKKATGHKDLPTLRIVMSARLSSKKKDIHYQHRYGCFFPYTNTIYISIHDLAKALNSHQRHSTNKNVAIKKLLNGVINVYLHEIRHWLQWRSYEQTGHIPPRHSIEPDANRWAHKKVAELSQLIKEATTIFIRLWR